VITEPLALLRCEVLGAERRAATGRGFRGRQPLTPRCSAFRAGAGYAVLADGNYLKALINGKNKDRALLAFARYQNEPPITGNALIPSSPRAAKTD